MIKPGSIQSLPVLEVVEKGYLLGDTRQQVFIPKRDLKPNTEPGEQVEVFTFYNEDKELEATTRLPEIQVGQIGCFRVGNSNDLGAFISIGSKRDILIPAREQLESLETGRMTLVVLLEDKENKRLYASTKLQRHLRNAEINYKRGDEVMLTIAEKIDIGRRVVVDGKHIAVLFRQEMTDNVRLGEKVKGFIRKVEGKDIVVSMQREGMELLEDARKKIMDYLEQNGGYVRLNDDTDPEEIKLRLHMSKKTFKKAAGMLYKEGKVLLTKFGVKINKTGVVPDGWQKNKIFEDDIAEEQTDKKSSDRSRSKSREDERPPRRNTDDRRSDDRKSRPSHSDRPKDDRPRESRDRGERKSYGDRERREPREDRKPSSSEPRTEKRSGDKPAPKKELTFKGKK
ncbi:MAG: hypothetical protein K1X54_06340 [Flavobacteriales bacterium]|nr:hypothetical protein [Flavobacteriales bacterium]